MEKQRGVRKTRIGKVVSDKMDKTVVVEVKRLVPTPSIIRSSGAGPGSRPMTPKFMPGGR